MNSTCELGDDAAHALKPYPDYKDSRIEWLGEVPKHWITERFKSLMHNIVEQTTERRGAGLYVALEHVESWTGRLRHAGLDVSFDSQVKCFRSGDVLFGKLRPYLAKVTRPTSDGICVGEFLVLRPRHSNATAPYMEQLLRSKPIIDAVNSSTFGAKMPRADWQFMGGMAIALPPLPEQAAIVRFLDHADRRIRRYIRAKQQLITLLEEQKQAVIHRAVTRGLDPNVRLKPSGVPWLGEVPKHWKTERAKWLFRKMEQPVRENDEVVTCFRDGVVTLRKNRRVRGFTEALKEIGYQGVRRGDLVIHAMDAFAGAIGVSDSDGKSTPVYSVCSPRQSANAYYYAFFVREMARSEWILALAKGIRERSTDFRFKDFASQWVPLPPLPEQAAIVSFLDRATADLDAATTSAQRETSLIREYHTHLIADVVTGKLDVREAAAGLPDEVKEPEPFDETSSLIDGEEEPPDDLDAVPEEAEV